MAAAGILAFWSMSVNAVLIDNGTYTTDTESGLDWLDVTETVYKSFNYVSQRFGFGEEFAGWGYATGDQFNTLIGNASGTVVSTYEKNDLAEVNHVSAADKLVFLLGSTLDTSFYPTTWDEQHGYEEGEGRDNTVGLLLDPAGSASLWVAFINDDDVTDGSGADFSTAHNHFLDEHETKFGQGSFLVRRTLDVVPVPEPSTLVLLGLGMAGLGFARKQKKS